MKYVFYHNDVHGLACVYALKKLLSGTVVPKSSNFSRPTVADESSLEGVDVYVCGLYYNERTLSTIQEKSGKKVHVFTNSEDLIKDLYSTTNPDLVGVWDKDISPLEGIYKYHDTEVPEVMRYIGMYQNWTFDSASHKNESLGMMYRLSLENLHVRGFDTEVWDNLTSKGTCNILKSHGKEIMTYIEMYNEIAREDLGFYSTMKVDGRNYKILAGNMRGDSEMLLGHRGVQYVDFVAGYMAKPGGYKIQLYNTKDTIHVGNIARKFGGGGKSSVASFTCKTLPFKQFGMKNTERSTGDKYLPCSKYLNKHAITKMYVESLLKTDRVVSKLNTKINNYSCWMINSPRQLLPYCTAAYIVGDVEIYYYWVSSGEYRYVITPISSDISLEKIAKDFNGEVVGTRVIVYNKTLPISHHK